MHTSTCHACVGTVMVASSHCGEAQIRKGDTRTGVTRAMVLLQWPWDLAWGAELTSRRPARRGDRFQGPMVTNAWSAETSLAVPHSLSLVFLEITIEDV